MSASARKSFRAPSTTTIPFDCSTIIELFGRPVMSVLPGATGTGTTRSAGPSLGKPTFAKAISHSVVRAPRAASVASSRGCTPDGNRKRAALGGRSIANAVRVSLRDRLAVHGDRQGAREADAGGARAHGGPSRVVDDEPHVAAEELVVGGRQPVDAARARVDVEP